MIIEEEPQIFRQSVADTGIVVPESIEITLDSRTWRFDESGITVNGANSEKSYRWIEIENVTAQKLTHDHLNFRKLSLSLPDDELKLSSNMEERQSWKGTEAEQILSFLHVHVPEDRWEITAKRGHPGSVTEAENRIAKIDHDLQEMKKIHMTLYVLVIVMSVVPIFYGNLKTIVLALIFGPLFFLWLKVGFPVQIDLIKQYRLKLEQWIHEKKTGLRRI